MVTPPGSLKPRGRVGIRLRKTGTATQVAALKINRAIALTATRLAKSPLIATPHDASAKTMTDR
jgi:hypothetical protein